MQDDILTEQDVYLVRQQKLAGLRKNGFDFPNHFKREHLALDLSAAYAHYSKEELATKAVSVKIAGRIVLRRIMGKASFIHIQDVSGRIQVYLKESAIPEQYELLKQCDLGDIVGISGELFITNSGELTVHAVDFILLTKSLRPLPDKYHGLSDQEMRYRKRYVDLIANEESRDVFIIRSQVVQALRQFLINNQFLEVETPMMHPIPGGAIARPFITHHNTYDMQLYLRIAPELYLKRLVVGGFERVFEINRNFRNEGISTRHNPEFTMVEFYQAYADYKDLMIFTEDMLQFICDTVLQTREVTYQNHVLNFNKPFKRISVIEAILEYHPNITLEQLSTIDTCRAVIENLQLRFNPTDGLGKLQMIIFEETIEHLLIQPTFVTDYPTEVSPLAKRSASNPDVTDRFEFFIAGREIANGFSELNDAEDQAQRFAQQVLNHDSGDLEAMHFDHDYIEALEYGLPPTAGEGIGIDRLVMLFTNSSSIRDVILFPQLRK